MIGGWRVRGLWLAFVLAAAVSCVLVLHRPVFDRLADLRVYDGAVRWTRSGGSLYEFAAGNGDPFTYPPFAAVVFWPLSWLPWGAVQVTWLAAVCFAVAGIAVAVAHRSDGVERRDVFAAATACVLVLSAPVQSDLRFGQVSIFVVMLALLDALELTPRRWRGLLIGFAAAIKLTPLLFVVYLVLVGRRRDAMRAAGAFVAAAAAAGLLLPADSLRFWTRTIFATVRIGDLASLGNQSLDALLTRAGLDQRERPVVWGVLVAMICGIALWQARRLARDGRLAHAAVLVGCATIAASPVSWTHHEVWTVLAGMLLVAAPTAGRRAAGAFLLVAMTLNLGDIAFELMPTPGLQYLFSNARGLGVALLCCVGFGSAVRRHRAGSPTARRTVAHAAAAILTGVAVFAVLPLPPSSDPGLHPYSRTEIGQELSGTTVTCGTGPCDLTFGGQLLLNWSGGTAGNRTVMCGVASAKVARLAVRTAPGAPQHLVPIKDLGDGQRVFCFSGTNLVYGQFLAYDAGNHLLDNPPWNVWK